MSRKFRLSQLVRSFFSTPNLPCYLQQLAGLYQRTFSTDASLFFEFTQGCNDSLPHDQSLQLIAEDATWDEEDLTRLSSNTYTLLKEWLSLQERRLGGPDPSPFAFSRRHIVRLGQKFATSGCSVNDSHVLFVPHPISQSTTSLLSTGRLRAGNIQEIFSHTRMLMTGEKKTQTFVVVSPFKQLPNRLRRYDVYREFPVVANQLFEEQVGNDVLIPMEQVVSHFGYVPITIQSAEDEDVGCVIAFPLNLEN